MDADALEQDVGMTQDWATALQAGIGDEGLEFDNPIPPYWEVPYCLPMDLRWALLTPAEAAKYASPMELEALAGFFDALNAAGRGGKSGYATTNVGRLLADLKSSGPAAAGALAGTEILTAETSNTGYLFINEAAVRAGPDSDCLWRQVYERASLKQTSVDGKIEKNQLGVEGWVPTTSPGTDKFGPDGAPQDWGPLVTAIERYLDAHYYLRKAGIVSVEYHVQFLLQATVPKDVNFSSNSVICRRWSIRWSMHNLGPGKLVIMVGPMLRGRAACKGSK